jgi:hypothetical protein
MHIAIWHNAIIMIDNPRMVVLACPETFGFILILGVQIDLFKNKIIIISAKDFDLNSNLYSNLSKILFSK